ncbi:hypothetical protein NC99_16330 [Sunxiuqinia dokdonensis]|uniref:Uncharacterized protein n=1 Tax=Sunxiuqinia dokdonensis TaxID=1409788 RepID=A0A0L8VAQ2_9BACT|nr:hypothetical protein NC99_16330 [Sunxiuqinia dokdonensis]
MVRFAGDGSRPGRNRMLTIPGFRFPSVTGLLCPGLLIFNPFRVYSLRFSIAPLLVVGNSKL